MKKSAKLSLALALMMGTTAGVNMAAPSSASAEISDKFRLEMNSLMGYYSDDHNLGGYAPTDGDKTECMSYYTNYTRLQLQYHQDKNTMFQARLHSGYETFGTNYGKKSDTFIDQSFLQLRDRKANMVYTLGKKGAYLGQGLVMNSTGGWNGAQVSFGNWYDPQCLLLMAGRKDNGSRYFAANYTKDIVKNWQMSLTGLYHDTQYTGKTKVVGNPDYSRLHLMSVGTHVKGKTVSFQGEYVRNFADEVTKGIYNKSTKNITPSKGSDARRAWYVEVYTGPTTDFGSGLPLQKPGTNVWSLKYQDIGCNAVDAHNPVFSDDAKGFRLSYGHTFKKGLSADVAVARMKDKGGNSDYDSHNGEWKTLVMGEVSVKFR